MATSEKIRPAGLDVDNANWTASAGTKFGATSDQSDTTYITTAVPLEAITLTLSDLTVAGNTAVVRLIIKARVTGDNTGEIGLRGRLNSTNINQARDNFNADASVQTVEVSFDITFLRPGGGQWLIDDINNLGAGIHETNWTTSQPNVLEIWVEVTYAETPTQLPGPREVASRILRRNRTQRDVMTGKVPPEFLDLELLTPFGAVHADAESAGYEGYEMQEERRGIFRLESIDLDMNDSIAEGLCPQIQGGGQQQYAVNLWDPGRALNSGALQDGAALLDGGQARSFDRDSPVYVPDPSDHALLSYDRVVAVQYDLEAIMGVSDGKAGRLMEGSRKNYLPRSSFRDGATGYSDFLNANVSKTTTEYSDWSPQAVLFDPGVSRYFTRFEILDNSANGGRIWPTSDTIAANSNCVFSIDYRYVGTGGGGWAMQRAVDSKWWNAATPGWQVSSVFNSLTGAVGSLQTRESFAIPIGSSNTTVDLYVAMPLGGTVGNKMDVFHVQLEVGAWASSRIVTGSATATRDDAQLTYTNNSGNRIWPASGGTLTLKVCTLWSSSQLPAGTIKTVLYCAHDASNYAHLYYDKDNGRWTFVLRVAGASYTAYKTATVTAGTSGVPIALGIRWTSSVGEHGLAAFTASIFVDGVKGTDAVASAAMTEAGTSTLYIGWHPAPYYLDGVYFDLELVQFVLSDDDIIERGL